MVLGFDIKEESAEEGGEKKCQCDENIGPIDALYTAFLIIIIGLALVGVILGVQRNQVQPNVPFIKGVIATDVCALLTTLTALAVQFALFFTCVKQRKILSAVELVLIFLSLLFFAISAGLNHSSGYTPAGDWLVATTCVSIITLITVIVFFITELVTVNPSK
ncbi:unnamed protein product [Calicophoron daubneyi]|uniref:PGG domain-containing protein n=1 Tax=Calicophoron daubneyi TaxID=300641 RepID=A0AAV2TLX2_CALDB